MALSAMSVHIVGPDEQSVSALLAKLQEMGSASRDVVVDSLWKRGKISKDPQDLQTQLDNEKRRFGKFYCSKGSIIDVIAASDREIPSQDGGHGDAQAKLLISRFVKSNDEFNKVLARYRKSLVVLVTSTTGMDSHGNHDSEHRYIAILHCLRVPFHHLKQANVSMQVEILKKAFQTRTLPSPLSSLSYFEQRSSKPKKRQGKSKKETGDVATFYKSINLPFYWDQNKVLPRNSLRSILLSESEQIQSVEHAQKGRSNRFVMRFLEGRGVANDLFFLEFERTIPSPVVVEILKDGIHIQGNLYSFLGCSTSGLKKRKALLIKGTNEDAHKERQKHGDFASIKTVSKQISRFSLLLSNVVPTSVVPRIVLEEADVETKTANFTDGCGRISQDLAAALYKETRRVLAPKSAKHHPLSSVPSVFQIRSLR